MLLSSVKQIGSLHRKKSEGGSGSDGKPPSLFERIAEQALPGFAR